MWEVATVGWRACPDFTCLKHLRACQEAEGRGQSVASRCQSWCEDPDVGGGTNQMGLVRKGHKQRTSMGVCGCADVCVCVDSEERGDRAQPEMSTSTMLNFDSRGVWTEEGAICKDPSKNTPLITSRLMSHQ